MTKKDRKMKYCVLLTQPLSRVAIFGMLLAFGSACSQAQGNANGNNNQTAAQGQAAYSAPQASQGNVAAAGAASVTVVHGQIVAVNADQKTVTLRSDSGKQVTVHVYNPYNLAAAKPGERFVAKFYEIATIQKMGPGQSAPTPSLTQGIVSAAPGQTPGAAFGSQLQFAVSVDAIDKKDRAISIKGPDGVVEVVNVANPEVLDQVQVGEQILVTLTDAVVVALDQEPGGSTSAAPAIDPGAHEIGNTAWVNWGDGA
jgi:hypothetical protein